MELGSPAVGVRSLATGPPGKFQDFYFPRIYSRGVSSGLEEDPAVLSNLHLRKSAPRNEVLHSGDIIPGGCVERRLWYPPGSLLT